MDNPVTQRFFNQEELCTWLGINAKSGLHPLTETRS